MLVIVKKRYCSVRLRNGKRKRAFLTEIDAKIALLRTKEDPGKEKLPCRCYRCGFCDMFHITSARDLYETGELESMEEKRKRESTASATSAIFKASQNREI